MKLTLNILVLYYFVRNIVHTKYLRNSIKKLNSCEMWVRVPNISNTSLCLRKIKGALLLHIKGFDVKASSYYDYVATLYFTQFFFLGFIFQKRWILMQLGAVNHSTACSVKSFRFKWRERKQSNKFCGIL